MPELPEVEVLRQSLVPVLVGRTIEGIRVEQPHLREVVDEARLTRLTVGRPIAAIGRRAKYLLIELAGDVVLVVHLGMSGRLSLMPTEAPRRDHEHVVFDLDRGQGLRFRDPRRFGLVFAQTRSRLAGDRHFRHLGIEPLSEAWDGATLRELAAGRRGPVKSFLMDGRGVVGVGNIYACEALFRAGIHPRRSVQRISPQRWQKLAGMIRGTLCEAIRQGGTTLNDFADAMGQEGYFRVSLSVYGREGEECHRCGRKVRRFLQAGRSTFYCPGCQR